MLNNHSRGKLQLGTMRPQRSGIGEKNKGKITISLGRNTPMMALLSERTRGVIIQTAYTTYLFTIISFV